MLCSKKLLHLITPLNWCIALHFSTFLIYKFIPDADSQLFLTPIKSKMDNLSPKFWDIQYIKSLLQPSIQRHMLLIHALTGCDTVSRIDGLGKGSAMKEVSVIEMDLEYPRVSGNFLNQ